MSIARVCRIYYLYFLMLTSRSCEIFSSEKLPKSIRCNKCICSILSLKRVKLLQKLSLKRDEIQRKLSLKRDNFPTKLLFISE